MYQFGSGVMFAFRNDKTPATPIQVGALQNVDVDISLTTKKLYGSRQFPLAIGRGTGAINSKAQMANFNALALNELFFGETADPTTGQLLVAVNESGTVPGSSTYTITVTNSATWSEDLGVVYASSGLPFKKVASSPSAGQYSVSAGVYTFSSSDASASVLISYTYTSASGGGKISITNQLLGSSPNFKMVLTQTFESKRLTLVLNKCTSSKFTIPTKLEDFWISDFDFEAHADSANNIGTLSIGD